MRNDTIGLVWGLMFGLLISSSAWSATITIAPSKDNMLIEDLNAADGINSNGADEFLFAGTTAESPGKQIRRGLLAFDVAGNIPIGMTIDSVSLTLNVSRSASGTADDISLHRVLADWGEGTTTSTRPPGGTGGPASGGDATWLHNFHDTSFWSVPGGDFEALASATTSAPTSGPVTWDSTSRMVIDVQSWLDMSATNFGWLIKGVESTNRTARRFDSREHSTVENWPKLTVDISLHGDLDDNLVVDSRDIDRLFNEIPGTVPPVHSKFDLDLTGSSNGTIEQADVIELVEVILGTSFGDVDLDRDVDTEDLTTSIMNFTSAGGSDKLWADGDMDGDSDVDTSDLTTSIINFTGAMTDAVSTVPEPSGLTLLIVGVLAGFGWGRHIRLRIS